MIRAIGLVVLVVAIAFPARGQSPGPRGGPADAVFQVVTYDREPDKDGNFRGHGFGTGFFISADGTALTASHVVYSAATDPKKYRLLAVVGAEFAVSGNEFYDASVVCASRLPYNPITPDANRIGIPPGRDVAMIKVTPSTAFEGRKATLYYLLRNGERLAWATAHTDRLPEFPFLTISHNLSVHVRIIGFGAISALPYKWTAEGEFSETWTAQDGTPVFDVISQNPAGPGDSGAPVLNDKNEVVGMWAWHSPLSPDKGTAQRSAALVNPCP
jgi:V8-like Glu-specific endopeptidase